MRHRTVKRYSRCIFVLVRTYSTTAMLCWTMKIYALSVWRQCPGPQTTCWNTTSSTPSILASCRPSPTSVPFCTTRDLSFVDPIWSVIWASWSWIVSRPNVLRSVGSGHVCTSIVNSGRSVSQSVCLSLDRSRQIFLKPGFRYPSWRPELTARVDGWPVSISVDG